MIGALFASLLASYVGTYYRLSRRGMAEAEAYGLEGFLYIPIEEMREPDDLRRQRWRGWCFAPANLIDRYFLGGPKPVWNWLFLTSVQSTPSQHVV